MEFKYECVVCKRIINVGIRLGIVACLKKIKGKTCMGVLKDITECDIGHKGMIASDGICYGCKFQNGDI